VIYSKFSKGVETKGERIILMAIVFLIEIGLNTATFYLLGLVKIIPPASLIAD
jgi:hypothetical protein